MNDLIESIREKLNIPDNLYMNLELESYLKDIEPSQYLEFFKMLSGDKFAYKNGMDRVAIVSASLIERKHAYLMRNVSSKANELANKFYMLKNDAVNNKPNNISSEDCIHFIQFDKVLMGGKRFLSDKEIEVLMMLGGSEFVSRIDIDSYGDSTAKIERAMQKINDEKQLMLSSENKKLLQ